MAEPSKIIAKRVIDQLLKNAGGLSKPDITNEEIEKVVQEGGAELANEKKRILNGGTPAYTSKVAPNSDIFSNLTDACNETVFNKRESDDSYYSNEQEKQPVRPEQVVNLNKEASSATQKTERKAKAYNNPKTERQSNDTTVGKPFNFKTVDAGGNEVNFKAKVMYGNFKMTPNDLERDNTPKNINTIKRYITKMVYESIGGWDRITRITVQTGYMIVNNVLISPHSNSNFNPNSLPLDIADYLKDGAIGYLFNWNMLLKMNNLLSVDIDSIDFYMSVVCTDLGFGRTGGYKTLFMSLPRLNVVKLGNNVLLRDAVLNPTPENKKVIDDLSDSIAKEKRGLAIFDGYEINIYGNTNAFQNWTWGNLRNYAKNRGNKGIFRFGLGCTARFLMSMGSTALNFGSHIVGGTFKLLRQAWKDGTTAIQ